MVCFIHKLQKHFMKDMAHLRMAKLYEVFTKAGHAVSCFFLPIYKEFFHL